MFSANTSQVSADQVYVEDVFSTYLYTGNGSLRNITNGIDLATKGGMVWIKSRSSGSLAHVLYDTARGPSYQLVSNASSAEYYDSTGLNNFNSDGFQIWNLANVNSSGGSYTSWTFREAPKFFDVVTYTGNGANRNIAHSLGVAPGCIIVKRTDAAADWQVYHRSNANTEYMVLNTTAAKATGTTRWNSTTPTATEFTVGTDTTVNASGGTYVAYLYAHDTTSDGIIQCGSYTEPSSGETEFTLGWEPQWLLVKRTDSTSDWQIFDNMRAMSYTNSIPLRPNSSGAEFSFGDGYYKPTPRGFIVKSGAFGAGSSVVYIAIRRGPMRTPTSGTSVFAPLAVTPVTGTVRTTGFPVDLSIAKTRTLTYGSLVTDRLRGFVGNTSPNPPTLVTSSTDAETTATYSPASYAFDNTGYKDGPELNGGYPTAYWNFRRAPSFFDEVCYTGTGVAGRTVSHNLGVAPELMIVKNRSSAVEWRVYNSSVGAGAWLVLNTSDAPVSGNITWNTTAPTASVFTVGGSSAVNGSGSNYVAYLFASCPGVSKVGSYTGNGSSQTINCGFAAGARFVMIKRTDSTGDWYVWDTARGIVSGNDPHLSLNTTAAEVTTDDSVDTDSSGFVVNQVAATNINVNAATYLYMAVA